ncbi:hypothetical protein ACW9HR_37405 [Nocardia gipuzkoensis]
MPFRVILTLFGWAPNLSCLGWGPDLPKGLLRNRFDFLLSGDVAGGAVTEVTVQARSYWSGTR